MKLFNIFCMFIYSNGMDNYRDARIELPPPPPSPVSTEKIYMSPSPVSTEKIYMSPSPSPVSTEKIYMLPSPSPVSTEKISYNYFLL